MLLHGLVKQASILVSLRSVLNIFDIVGTSAPVYALRIWTEVSTWTLIREEQDPVYKQHSCSWRGQCSTVRRRSLDTESLLFPGWSGVGHVSGQGFPSPPDLVSRWAIPWMLTLCCSNPVLLRMKVSSCFWASTSQVLGSWGVGTYPPTPMMELWTFIGSVKPNLFPPRGPAWPSWQHIHLNQLTMGGVFPL